MANEQDTVFLTSVGLHNDAMDSRIEQLLVLFKIGGPIFTYCIDRKATLRHHYLPDNSRKLERYSF